MIFLLAMAGAVHADESFTARVVGISDGDTIKVLRVHPDGHKEQVKIRLYGIDCPEKGQAWGKRAKQFTAKLAAGKTVTLIVRDKDRYGRLVADVILPDGCCLNHEIVRAGFAWWYRKYARKDAVLERLEKEAWVDRRGLWVDKNPVPPWEWRKR